MAITTTTSGRSANGALAAPSRMTDKEFSRFSEFIYKEVGIKLPPAKKTMIEARLQKRLRLLKIPDHQQYLAYLFSDRGMAEELRNLIDVVTTNTTDFFREPKHFEILAGRVVPQWIAENGSSRALDIWSAGCSTGMEPYTLAMVLTDYAEKTPGFRFSIMATDISTQALQTASRAVYDEDRVAPVPMPFKKKYLLRSKSKDKRLVRIVPELRRVVNFRRLNFMEELDIKNPLDIIFCRNVIIYFDRETQERLFGKFCRVLRQGGYIFIGHSESLSGMDLPLEQVAPTVYRKVG
jgi:chemotaxis protein methyltransferase CheR